MQLREEIPQKIALHLTSIQQLLPAIKADAADAYNLLGPLKSFVDWATPGVAIRVSDLAHIGLI